MADRTEPCRPPSSGDARGAALDVSLVAPARNERDNVAPLVREIGHVMSKTGLAYELILVDDASDDGTAEAIRAEQAACDELRALRLAPGPRRGAHGQSAALHAGLSQARGRVVVTLDADLQNDPADIPRLLALLERERADMVQGDRSATRRDGPLRRAAALVGRLARRAVLGDTIRDTGCSLRVFRREVIDALPLELAGLHRFLPYCARLRGHRVIETPVAHRPRLHGRSKIGALDRALPGLIDLLAVRWMTARLRRPLVHELAPPPHADPE